MNCSGFLVDRLEEWQTWINETSKEYRLFEKVPEKILRGETIIRVLGIKPGPMVGVLVEWAFDDQMNGVIVNEEQALIVAREYLKVIKANLVKVEEKGVFAREVSQKSKFKNPEDEVLLWLKTERVKEQVLAMVI